MHCTFVDVCCIYVSLSAIMIIMIFVLSLERKMPSGYQVFWMFWGLLGRQDNQRNEANNFDAKALWVHFLDPRRKMLRHKAVDLQRLRKIGHGIHQQIISQWA